MSVATLYTNEGSLSFYRGTNFWGFIEKIAKGCHLELEVLNYTNVGSKVKRNFRVTGTEEDIRNWQEIILTMNDLFE